MRYTKACSSKTESPHPGTCINKIADRRLPHVLFDCANLRVARAWEFDMDECLLFVHDNRTSTERVNISPYITSRKKLIDFWNGKKV
jgi:hypothetical protein